GLQRVLIFNHPGGAGSSIRRTGEYRDPRIAHSVGCQNLLPFGIKGHSAQSSHGGQRSALGGAVDHPQRRDVALSLSGKYCGDMVFPTGDPQLVVLGVNSDSGGAFQVCGWPCEYPLRRYIAIAVSINKADGIVTA